MTTQTNTQTTLDDLTQQFAQWRASRPNKRTAVPEHLRRQALTLLSLHRKSHLIKALNINYQMLKNWQSAAEHFASDHPAFVALDTQSLPDHSASLSCFTLTYACGETLQVNGQFSLAQLTALAQGLSPVRGGA